MTTEGGLPFKGDDWEVLLSFLPSGWQEKARELGALQRCRKFADPESLLRTLLIHLADGCSLRETSVRAKHGNIVSISDVALLKRLKSSGEWFRWMASQLMETWINRKPSTLFGQKRNVRLIDGSTIQEPGSTGSTWRIHYSTNLPSLRCDEVFVTDVKTAESFKMFTVHAGDLFVADRGYARRADISHVFQGHGDVLVRINLFSIPFSERDGAEFPLLERLRTLSGTRIGDWPVSIFHNNERIPGRICAIRKSKQAAEMARKKVLRRASKQGHKAKPETLESSAYTFVFTTLGADFNPSTVLEMYRGRWQVELVFKRLKSLMALGHLKKKDSEAAKAWVHGKILIAFLIEALILAGESFSPWGFPIRQDIKEVSMHMEGNISGASHG